MDSLLWLLGDRSESSLWKSSRDPANKSYLPPPSTRSLMLSFGLLIAGVLLLRLWSAWRQRKHETHRREDDARVGPEAIALRGFRRPPHQPVAELAPRCLQAETLLRLTDTVYRDGKDNLVDHQQQQQQQNPSLMQQVATMIFGSSEGNDNEPFITVGGVQIDGTLDALENVIDSIQKKKKKESNSSLSSPLSPSSQSSEASKNLKQPTINSKVNIKKQARVLASEMSLERLVQEHLALSLLYFRWIDPDGYAQVPQFLFNAVPLVLRWTIPRMIRKRVKQSLIDAGLTQDGPHELARQSAMDINDIAAFLGCKHPYSPDGCFATCKKDALRKLNAITKISENDDSNKTIKDENSKQDDVTNSSNATNTSTSTSTSTSTTSTATYTSLSSITFTFDGSQRSLRLDAVLYGVLANIVLVEFPSPLRTACLRHACITDYLIALTDRAFPEHSQAARQSVARAIEAMEKAALESLMQNRYRPDLKANMADLGDDEPKAERSEFEAKSAANAFLQRLMTSKKEKHQKSE